jgi:hypothetical protein
MKMDPAKQIEGFFIEFNPDEMEDVRCELERRGYTDDGQGIKDALMDFLFDDDTPNENTDVERIINKARKFVVENPATVQFGLNAISGLARKIGKRR